MEARHLGHCTILGSPTAAMGPAWTSESSGREEGVMLYCSTKSVVAGEGATEASPGKGYALSALSLCLLIVKFSLRGGV